MPNFKSPLGTKQFSGQPMREFVVPDESEYMPQNRQYNQFEDDENFQRSVEAAMAFQQQMDQQAVQQYSQPSLEESLEIERQIKAAKMAKKTGKERLNDGAKRRVEMLIKMTRHGREFQIDGNQYALQTISSKEMREVMSKSSEFDGTIQFPFELRRQLLAYSLVMVAGIDIDQFVGSSDIEARLELIDSLGEAILNRIYNEYTSMINESIDKYSIKNEEELKEVMEDLKK